MTNNSHKKLGVAAEKLLRAARKYYKEMEKVNLSAGCIWITDKEGAMVIFTRGEYRQRLLINIENELNARTVYNFGIADLETRNP